MTVRECLEFSARLKLPGTDEEKMRKVKEIIMDLKLNKCQDTFIGGSLLKGVSGGERKRTSIGVALITNPSLIFLDEPTTGLDSYTATQVMLILRNLANAGRTIIQTIHQPNSDIFQLFDQLMLLAQGRVIYYNQSSLSVDYFSKIGFQVPELSNPADYFMSIMSIESMMAEDAEKNEAARSGGAKTAALPESTTPLEAEKVKM
jgi:ABC-type multidrug transport system ATPase subunit